MSDGQSDEVPEFDAPEAGFTSKNVDRGVVGLGIVRDRRRDRRGATHHYANPHAEHDRHHTGSAVPYGGPCGACSPEQHCSFAAAGILVGNDAHRGIDAGGLFRARNNTVGTISERSNRQ